MRLETWGGITVMLPETDEEKRRMLDAANRVGQRRTPAVRQLPPRYRYIELGDGSIGRIRIKDDQ